MPTKLDIHEIAQASAQSTTEAGEVYRRLTDYSLGKPRAPRPVYLRPSSLPVCSVTLLKDMLLHRHRDTVDPEHFDSSSFMGDLFVEMGTAVHQTVER